MLLILIVFRVRVLASKDVLRRGFGVVLLAAYFSYVIAGGISSFPGALLGGS